MRSAGRRLTTTHFARWRRPVQRSKALASVLRFVVILRGYSGTPAEEMPGEKTPEPVKQPEESPELQAAKAKILELHEQKGDKRKMSREKVKANLRAIDTVDEAVAYSKTIPIKENA
jgi:hypothetical protein